jgi:hypothetical protein
VSPARLAGGASVCAHVHRLRCIDIELRSRMLLCCCSLLSSRGSLRLVYADERQ